MPKTLSDLKDNALAWSIVFIITSFAAVMVYQNNRIAGLYEKNATLSSEFVRLERYQADRAITQDMLRRIETNIDKLLMMMVAAKDGRKETPWQR